MSNLLSTMLMLPLISSLFSGSSTGTGMSSLLPLMLLGGGGGSMSSLLPLMLLSGAGSSGDALSTIAPVMIAQKVMKPTRRRYSRRGRSTATRLAYLSGVVSALKARS